MVILNDDAEDRWNRRQQPASPDEDDDILEDDTEAGMVSDFLNLDFILDHSDIFFCNTLYEGNVS